MERQFMIQEITALRENSAYKKYGITETELRRRVEWIVKDYGDCVSFSNLYWRDIVLPILLHGEPQERDEIKEWVERTNHVGIVGILVQ